MVTNSRLADKIAAGLSIGRADYGRPFAHGRQKGIAMKAFIAIVVLTFGSVAWSQTTRPASPTTRPAAASPTVDDMFKQLLVAAGIPTPDYQFITRVGAKVNPELGVPLIVKLNETLPLASVLTMREVKNVCPWPCIVTGLQVGFEKN